MAHKSKTQRAKAANAKANRKERQQREEALVDSVQSEEASEAPEKSAKPSLFKKKEESVPAKAEPAATAKKDDKPKEKKTRFKFFKDVRAELKRVTWPTRTDVLRWSGVVVAALLFFGIFTAVLDNLIITPALVALSGLGAH